MPGPKYVKEFPFEKTTKTRVREHTRELPYRGDSGTTLVTAIHDMANDESGIAGKKFRPGFKKGGAVSKSEDKKEDKAMMVRHNRLMHPDQKPKLSKGGANPFTKGKKPKGALSMASAIGKPSPKLGKGNYGTFGKKPMIGE